MYLLKIQRTSNGACAQSIDDHSSPIDEIAIKLDDIEVADRISKLILQLHEIACTSHEKAINSMFSHAVSVAESVRLEKNEVEALFRRLKRVFATFRRRLAVIFSPLLLRYVEFLMTA